MSEFVKHFRLVVVGEFSPLLEPSGEYRTAVHALPQHLVFICGGIGVTPAIAALKGGFGKEIWEGDFLRWFFLGCFVLLGSFTVKIFVARNTKLYS